MPIGFDLRRFATVTRVFCETGTYHGNGLLTAMDANFSQLASIEVSEENLGIAHQRIAKHRAYPSCNVRLILGDSADKIGEIVDFALQFDSRHAVFWLDAHTHVFDDGTMTGGADCPLEKEIEVINQAFRGNAIVLIDDLRIIGAPLNLPRGMRSRIRLAYNALLFPDRVASMLRPGWGQGTELLSVVRLATGGAEAFDVSIRILDGVEHKDVLCVYPSALHQRLFG